MPVRRHELVRVGRIEFRGNGKTRDKVMRLISPWQITEGQKRASEAYKLVRQKLAAGKEAADKLKEGALDAFFSVSGWPLGAIAELRGQCRGTAQEEMDLVVPGKPNAAEDLQRTLGHLLQRVDAPVGRLRSGNAALGLAAGDVHGRGADQRTRDLDVGA